MDEAKLIPYVILATLLMFCVLIISCTMYSIRELDLDRVAVEHGCSLVGNHVICMGAK